MFRCGYTFCKTGAEACRVNFEKSFECQALPAECQVEGADCTCMGPLGEWSMGGCNCYEPDYYEPDYGFVLDCGYN
jgi:hypothetical protein